MKPLIIGNPHTFAIESQISIGYFVLHIGGRGYGVHEPNATMLANAFDTVGEILAKRGLHTAAFASEPEAGAILNAIGLAIYAPDPRTEAFFGIPVEDFQKRKSLNYLEWGRGCDEAFDDGSRVLLFDVANRVRLIADRPPWEQKDYMHDPKTLRDVWLKADEFYKILHRWRDAFEAEWARSRKVSEQDEGSEGAMAQIHRLEQLTEGIRVSRGGPHHYDDVPQKP
jgi:hypothetical protein